MSLPDHDLHVLISQAELQNQVTALAQKISEDYHQQPLTLVGIMTGSLLFLADLMRQLQIPHHVGLLHASSYEGTATLPSQLRTNLDYLPPLQDRHVLIIDDILDTGQTLTHVCAQIQKLKPASLKTAVLLWKQARTTVPLQPDYLGFSIEDHFVVGYGLDFDNNYRHLPEIQVVKFR